MQELDKKLEILGKMMSVVIYECDNCPLEKICDSAMCELVWKNFFKAKVKEDGMENE